MSNNETWRQPPPFRDPRIKENHDLQDGDIFQKRKGAGRFWVIVYRAPYSNDGQAHAFPEKFTSREAAERAISRYVDDGEFADGDQVWTCLIIR